MKTFKRLGCLLAFIMIASVAGYAQGKKDPAKTLRHVVMFKFKDSSPPSEIKKIEDAFVALEKKIKLIKDFEWGTNNSSTSGELNQGLTHCFLVTFKSEEDLKAYLIHPDHKAFVELMGPHMEKLTVVDYWVKP